MDNIELTAISNKIILTRANFSLLERRILAAIVDSISPNLIKELETHKEFKKQPEYLNMVSKALHKNYQLNMYGDISKITYKASDLCRPDQYKELRQTLMSLRKRGVDQEFADGNWFGSSLVLSYIFEARSEMLQLQIDEQFYKMLFNLKEGYTLYQTRVALSFSSIYAMQLYEYIAMWRNQGFFRLTVNQLREFTDTLNKYPLTKDLKKYVLDIAQKQINESEISDLKFTYKEVKVGRKIVAWDIVIQKTNLAHDEVLKKVEQVSLRWDYGIEFTENMKRFGLVFKGKNLETLNFLKELMTVNEIGKEIERVHTIAQTKRSPPAYVNTCLQNLLKDKLGKTKEPAEMTVQERKQHAENVRKQDIQAADFGDLFNQIKPKDI